MATRIYLPSSGVAPVSPAFDSAWDDTSIGAKLPCYSTKKSTAMTTVSFLDTSAIDKDILFRQFVSPPMAAITITSQTVSIRVRAAELDIDNELFISWTVKVFSLNGGTERGTILANTRSGSELPLTTLTNRGGSAASTQVIAQENDRLVIEIGVGGNPGAGDHDSNLVFGDDNASDLPEDETTTTANNPWINFATSTITFNAEPATGGATYVGGGFF